VKSLISNALVIIAISQMGCSSPTDLSNVTSLKELKSEQLKQKLKKKQSDCQKSYLSASVSMRDRQSSAKDCDFRASQYNTEAKQNEKRQDDEQ
jgi:hypothetical protein